MNLRTTKYDVYIGRAGKGKDGYYGNPFQLKPGETRGATIERYREYFYKRMKNDPMFEQMILQLKGKVLGCFCAPFPCHGDVIVEYLDDTEYSSKSI